MDVTCLVVHGIGTNDNIGQFDEFCAGIRKHLPKDLSVSFIPVAWAFLLEERERKILSWYDGYWLQSILKYVSTLVCDVLAYAYPKGVAHRGDFIHDITEILTQQHDAVPDHNKVVLIGHSLGAQICLGFVLGDRPGEVDGLVTMGAPINWFSIRYADFGRFNNDYKGPWLNLYNRKDLVSSRVGCNPNFKAHVADVEVGSWNPIKWLLSKAHGIYWTHAKAHEEIANLIKKVSA